MRVRTGVWMAAWFVALAGLQASAQLQGLKTFSSSGKELKVLGAGGEANLLVHQGKGCLSHMWFGGDWEGYETTIIRVYVDGEEKASIEMELGMGHGIGFADDTAPWGVPKLGKTGHPSGLYNNYQIPFGTSVRVTAQRGKDVREDPPFWWIIRGTENLPVTLGGVRLPENARLKLYKREGYTAKTLEEFDLCKTDRSGALFMVAMAAECEVNFNYMEARMRAYVDGKETPMFLSSGLEDYFLGTYYFNRGRYYNPIAGVTHIDADRNAFSAYRFHDEDPVFFQRGFRLTCRCGDEADGKRFGDPRPTAYTTYAWVYEW